MYYPPSPPYMPYQSPPPQDAPLQEEIRALRKVSFWLCATIFAVMVYFWLFPPVLLAFFSTLRNASANASYYGFSPLLFQLFSCVVYLFCVGVPVLLYFASHHGNLNDALPFAPVRFLTAVPAVIFGSGVCLLANFPASFVSKVEAAAGFSPPTPSVYIQNSIAAQVFYFISMVIIPSIVEEMLFRGAVLHALRHFGDIFAIVGSAFLFGLFHGNVPQFVFAFLCGLIMAFLVIKTNCLWISIAIHFLNNALSVCIDLVTYYYGADLSQLVYSISLVTLLMLGLISAIFLAFFNRDFFHTDFSLPSLHMTQKFGALLGNWGGISVLAFSLFEAYLRLAS